MRNLIFNQKTYTNTTAAPLRGAFAYIRSFQPECNNFPVLKGIVGKPAFGMFFSFR
jgi:hypothetical protein